MPKESTQKTKEKLPAIKLRGFEKCQNSEEFNRLMNVMRGDDPCAFRTGREMDGLEEMFREERRRAIAEKIARERGFI